VTNEPLRYEILIYWSADDETFIAEIPELAGCMADGPTPADALANVQLTAQEWMDTAAELGRRIPEPKGCSSPSRP